MRRLSQPTRVWAEASDLLPRAPRLAWPRLPSELAVILGRRVCTSSPETPGHLHTPHLGLSSRAGAPAGPSGGRRRCGDFWWVRPVSWASPGRCAVVAGRTPMARAAGAVATAGVDGST